MYKKDMKDRGKRENGKDELGWGQSKNGGGDCNENSSCDYWKYNDLSYQFGVESRRNWSVDLNWVNSRRNFMKEENRGCCDVK